MIIVQRPHKQLEKLQICKIVVRKFGWDNLSEFLGKIQKTKTVNRIILKLLYFRIAVQL